MNRKAMVAAIARLEGMTHDPFLPLPHEAEIRDIVGQLRAALSSKSRGGWSSDLPKHQVHSETSREAAEHVAPNFSRSVRKVFRAFEAATSAGWTDEEAANYLNMTGNSYRPCRVDLMDQGLVHDSGRRRKTAAGRNAVVWLITDKGLEHAYR